jgi:hypothetical protein
LTINYDDRLPNFNFQNIAMGDPVPGHPRPRFPGFWETKMDYTPDNDHGSVSANALQSLLLQSDESKIYLLPAWPEDWDVAFKLHAPQNTTVEAVYRSGRIQSLKVTPLSRQADVIDMSSLENRVRTLAGVACADRNYLFEIPPMLDARVSPGDQERLKTTGPGWPNMAKALMAHEPARSHRPPGAAASSRAIPFTCTFWTPRSSASLCRASRGSSFQ